MAENNYRLSQYAYPDDTVLSLDTLNSLFDKALKHLGDFASMVASSQEMPEHLCGLLAVRVDRKV